ncbi:hypothetical protein D9611_002341 [Ephemerocybe angulata]|uniref:Synembryn-A n=1 Tax=Ephemerocybe angulata TaxID=980116 RepID=A0A8H5FDS5_9AGAR|nr:hypothetical protein D9611_002341 [Tulosesus angulatus]
MPSAVLERYKALTNTSTRNEVSAVLNSIILASPSTLDPTARRELITQILDDLKAVGKRRLLAKDAAQALLAVKTLGREPSGSEVIASTDNLKTLLSFQSTFKDIPDAATEALRCIANSLLLIESGRSLFLEKGVDGGDSCVLMLEKAQAPDQIFILARILFLATASGSTYLVTMMEKKYNSSYLVDIIGSKLECLINPVQSGATLAREAMTDLLKFTFNILLYYPNMTEAEPQNADQSSNGSKVLGDFWDPKLTGLLSPILRVFLRLQPSSPCPMAAPLTHTIHALIGFPIAPALKTIWFSTQPVSPSRTSSSNSPKAPSPKRLGSQSSSRSQSPSRSSPTTSKPSTLDRALSVLTAGRSRSRSPSPVVTSSTQVVNKALDLLDATLTRYFPGKTEADDASVREKVKKESTDTLDDLLSPIVVLITKLCVADETCRTRVRQFIVPDDLDRSSPLEERSDILGRCLRLMGSVYHARLKDAIGEMIFAACDNNASILSAFFGYGNVAGFLFNKGIMTAPPPSEGGPIDIPTTSATGEAINPITGSTVQPKSTGPDMTDEEKEREMDKLLVLFDRMEKIGALPKDQNPIRKAIHEGKFANS